MNLFPPRRAPGANGRRSYGDTTGKEVKDMSNAEIHAILQNKLPLYRQQPIEGAGISPALVNTLAGKGIRTVGALVDTDAFRAITSGRYDIDSVREVNGIPIDALRWVLEEMAQQSGYEPGPLCAG